MLLFVLQSVPQWSRGPAWRITVKEPIPLIHLPTQALVQLVGGNFARSGGYDKEVGVFDFALLCSEDGERSLYVMAVLCV